MCESSSSLMVLDGDICTSTGEEQMSVAGLVAQNCPVEGSKTLLILQDGL